MKRLAKYSLFLVVYSAHAQISFFYPEWYENPTFEVANNFSASACEAVENDDLSTAKQNALEEARKQIASYLSGLPSDVEDGSGQAVKGVYLSTSQRVIDQDKNKEMFCVLASIPYSRIEDAMQTGLNITELEKVLAELTPSLNLAAKGIIKNPSSVAEFYQNALAFAAINEIDLAFNAFSTSLEKDASYWDVHQSFIAFANEEGRSTDAALVYQNLTRSQPESQVALVAQAFLNKTDSDTFTSETLRIADKSPDCIMCYAMIAAQHTYKFGAGILTRSQEEEQAAAFASLEALGGLEVMKDSFLQTANYRDFHDSLKDALNTLRMKQGIANTYGANTLKLHIVDIYGTQLEQYRAMGAAGARGLALLKKPATLNAIIIGLEPALTLRWRIRGHTDYVNSGKPSDTQLEAMEASFAALPKTMREQQMATMRQTYLQMDKGFNHITNEEYEKPSLTLRVPGELPPGNYVIDIIYTDLRGKEIGPVSIQLDKPW